MKVVGTPLIALVYYTAAEWQSNGDVRGASVSLLPTLHRARGYFPASYRFALVASGQSAADINENAVVAMDTGGPSMLLRSDQILRVPTMRAEKSIAYIIPDPSDFRLSNMAARIETLLANDPTLVQGFAIVGHHRLSLRLSNSSVDDLCARVGGSYVARERVTLRRCPRESNAFDCVTSLSKPRLSTLQRAVEELNRASGPKFAPHSLEQVDSFLRTNLASRDEILQPRFSNDLTRAVDAMSFDDGHRLRMKDITSLTLNHVCSRLTVKLQQLGRISPPRLEGAAHLATLGLQTLDEDVGRVSLLLCGGSELWQVTEPSASLEISRQLRCPSIGERMASHGSMVGGAKHITFFEWRLLPFEMMFLTPGATYRSASIRPTITATCDYWATRSRRGGDQPSLRLRRLITMLRDERMNSIDLLPETTIRTLYANELKWTEKIDAHIARLSPSAHFGRWVANVDELYAQINSETTAVVGVTRDRGWTCGAMAIDNDENGVTPKV